MEWEYTVSDGKASVGDGWSSAIPSSTSGAIVIPSTLGGCPVTSIGDYAFNDCSSLTSVQIPDGVTKIGFAFSGCESLTKVSLPDGLEVSDIRDVFSDTPFVKSDTFPELILSRSSETLYGLKIKVFDQSMDVYEAGAELGRVDITVPATVKHVVGDYVLGAISAYMYDSYHREYFHNDFPLVNLGRLIFTGDRPSASEKVFLFPWSDDFARDKVYYKRGRAEWTWGEEWNGVKTYELDEIPADYSVESNFEIGTMYGGYVEDIYGYKSRELWDGNDLYLGGDDGIFIPVTGNGVISPVVFLNGMLTNAIKSLEVWTDKQMFDKFVPKTSSSSWDDDEEDWEYENETTFHCWPKKIWPQNKVVANRQWIVIWAKDVDEWAGVSTFRVGISGTSVISDSIVAIPGGEYMDTSMLGSFFRGIAVGGVEEVCVDDSPVLSDENGRKLCGKHNWSFENMEQVFGQSKFMSFTVNVPSAGTLVVSGEYDEDDSLALEKAVSVSGRNIVSDYESVMSHESDSEDYQYSEDNLWKSSSAACFRRIEVSGATTLTFKRKNRDDMDCEFNRMYFYPAEVKSVAIDAAYESYLDEYTGYRQGYVTGLGVYKSGETAILEAVPGPEEEFECWEVKYGDFELTEEQRTSPVLRFAVTDEMCGVMAEEKLLFFNAVWKKKASIAAYPSIVGAGEVVGSRACQVGETVTLTATAAEGCTFVKWSDGETAATRTVTAVDAGEEFILYACFEAPNGVPNPNARCVIFDPNGGSVDEEERNVEIGAALGTPPTPVRSKYKFLGWYTEPEGGTKVTATTKVTGDVTYYAQWVYDGSATVSANVFDDCKDMGKVTGGKMAKAGTKVTLKATANKGYVFAGWFEYNEEKDDCVPCDSSESDYRNPSYAYTVGEDDKTFYAMFKPVEKDDVLMLLVNDGMEDSLINPDAEELETFTVEGEQYLKLTVLSASLPKVSVKGLPSGMKFTDKPVYKKGSKTEIEYPANTIYGTPTKPGVYKVSVSLTNASIKKAIVCEFEIFVPNFVSPEVFPGLSPDPDEYCFEVGTGIDSGSINCAASSGDWKVTVSGLPAGLKYDAANGRITGVATKPGVYTVTFTAKRGKETEVATITMNIEALPAAAYGSFNGFVTRGDGLFNKVGSFQMTVSDVGKISAKVVTAAGSYSYSATGWTVVGWMLYNVDMQSKKGDCVYLYLSPDTAWNDDQITGWFIDAEGNEYNISAQKTVFGEPWYFKAKSNDGNWVLVRTWDKKAADITVTVKDGITKLAGKIDGMSVNSSGFVNMSDFAAGCMKASFTPVVTVNKVKKVLVVDAVLSFDSSVIECGMAGFNE